MKKLLSVVLSILFAICLLGTLLLSVVRNNFSYSKLVKMAGEMMKPVSAAPVEDGLFHPGDIRYSLAAYEELGDFSDFDLSSIDLSSIDLTNMDINEIVDKKLGVIDLASAVLAMENKMPMMLFGLNSQDSIIKTVTGNFTGTTIKCS